MRWRKQDTRSSLPLPQRSLIRKTAKTTKPYTTEFKGYQITVPVGSTVSNQTALGLDDRYRFWEDFHATAREITGVESSGLKHDLTYRGLNIPAEYCEEYPS